MVYILESSYNSADTCRDPDDIHKERLGVYKTFEKAKGAAIDYVNKHFFNKNQTFYEADGKTHIRDLCSYPTKLTIEKLEVE